MFLGTFDNFLKFGWEVVTGEFLMSLVVMGIIIILSIVIFFLFRKKDPTKPEKGFCLVVCMIVEKIDDMVQDLMGSKYKGFGGYVLGLASYIALSFLIGLTGLPGPMTSLGNTLSIALCTFILIHANAVKANGWGYFHRYIEPIPVLLPINLLSMWAPFLSLGLRIFGNALSGYTLMSMVYMALGKISNLIFGGFISGGASYIILPPLFTPILHAYFDVFSGAIQTLIFIMLTMIQVAQEDPDPELA